METTNDRIFNKYQVRLLNISYNNFYNKNNYISHIYIEKIKYIIKYIVKLVKLISLKLNFNILYLESISLLLVFLQISY